MAMADDCCPMPYSFSHQAWFAFPETLSRTEIVIKAEPAAAVSLMKPRQRKGQFLHIYAPKPTSTAGFASATGICQRYRKESRA
ncbi:hypothetical protein PtA15_12A95 [Puccinia triticina]|uniref:Uncharacterized protein n=1 Tax=Puccinia triticina TaxID=208348 RepID=A0ABY7D280_9BASI|nr:uncharacterized protein PtA15_12A95 [Puccinia triticina]WAQ90110.1 hypothetical protein PtA15_12A95 [Puccinia triticina]